MKQDRFSTLDTAKIKGKYDFTCSKCRSMENIQAHDPTGFHIDWRQGIALCGDCHSKEHPDVPKDLFLLSKHQPYWPNVSARALAEEFGVHSRTIVRRAKRLNISPIYPLSDGDKEDLRKPLMGFNRASENDMMSSIFTMQQAITLPTLKCKRCGHEWVPRTTQPRLCPKCKNPWNTLKQT